VWIVRVYGEVLVSGGTDYKIRVWDIASGTEIRHIGVVLYLFSLSLSLYLSLFISISSSSATPPDGLDHSLAG
jgi:WD40 repeat protein